MPGGHFLGRTDVERKAPTRNPRSPVEHATSPMSLNLREVSGLPPDARQRRTTTSPVQIAATAAPSTKPRLRFTFISPPRPASARISSSPPQKARRNNLKARKFVTLIIERAPCLREDHTPRCVPSRSMHQPCTQYTSCGQSGLRSSASLQNRVRCPERRARWRTPTQQVAYPHLCSSAWSPPSCAPVIRTTGKQSVSAAAESGMSMTLNGTT